ncbi:MAG: hypothetical protein EOM50_01720 [Erysipelotrichia bacterium]|nr:hypothetical protein [Erysipelotrichia bacterium]
MLLKKTYNVVTSTTTGGSFSVGDLSTGTKKINNIGVWELIHETMSDKSRNYRKYITGADDGMVYKVNGVKFDGFKDGVLIKAKKDYTNLINKITEEFRDWFTGGDSLIRQAQRQLSVANGTLMIRIQWKLLKVC